MFDGYRVGLLFETSLYAKQPTAEELLKPGIKHWCSSEECQPVNSYVTVTTRTTRSPFRTITSEWNYPAVFWNATSQWSWWEFLIISLISLATNMPPRGTCNIYNWMWKGRTSTNSSCCTKGGKYLFRYYKMSPDESKERKEMVVLFQVLCILKAAALWIIP
jgi:hypothetical protein